MLHSAWLQLSHHTAVCSSRLCRGWRGFPAWPSTSPQVFWEVVNHFILPPDHQKNQGDTFILKLTNLTSGPVESDQGVMDVSIMCTVHPAVQVTLHRAITPCGNCDTYDTPSLLTIQSRAEETPLLWPHPSSRGDKIIKRSESCSLELQRTLLRFERHPSVHTQSVSKHVWWAEE